MINIAFRAEHYYFSHSLDIKQLWVSMLNAIYCKNKIFYSGLRGALISEYSNMSQSHFIAVFM